MGGRNWGKDDSDPEKNPARRLGLERFLSVKGAVIAAAGVLVAAGIADAFYTIPTDSVGVVTRFGKYIETTSPGLRFKAPFIDEVVKVPLNRVRMEEFGFRTINASEGRTEYLDLDSLNKNTVSKDAKTDFLEEQRQLGEAVNEKSDLDGEVKRLLQQEYLTLTGDLNMVDVEYSVQWDVADPVAFSFNIDNPRMVIRKASQAAMRQVLGDRSSDEAITIGRADIEIDAAQGIQEILDQTHTGMRVISGGVKIQAINPPQDVIVAYSDVTAAKQNKERSINEAQALWAKEIPPAEGIAKGSIEGALGYATKIVNEAKGEIDRFSLNYEGYKKNPEIVQRNMIYGVLQEIMEKSGAKTIIDPELKSILPHYDLSKEVKP
jgi:membrane protease subunit HflK